jgi:hypothetical protein
MGTIKNKIKGKKNSKVKNYPKPHANRTVSISTRRTRSIGAMRTHPPTPPLIARDSSTRISFRAAAYVLLANWVAIHLSMAMVVTETSNNRRLALETLVWNRSYAAQVAREAGHGRRIGRPSSKRPTTLKMFCRSIASNPWVRPGGLRARPQSFTVRNALNLQHPKRRPLASTLLSGTKITAPHREHRPVCVDCVGCPCNVASRVCSIPCRGRLW